MNAGDWAATAIIVVTFGVSALLLSVMEILERLDRKQRALTHVRRRADEQAKAFNRDPDEYLRHVAQGRDPVAAMRPAPRPPRGSGGVAR